MQATANDGHATPNGQPAPVSEATADSYGRDTRINRSNRWTRTKLSCRSRAPSVHIAGMALTIVYSDQRTLSIRVILRVPSASRVLSSFFAASQRLLSFCSRSGPARSDVLCSQQVRNVMWLVCAALVSHETCMQTARVRVFAVPQCELQHALHCPFW